VKLEIYSSKNNAPVTKILDHKSIQHIWADFDAFRTTQSHISASNAAEKH